MLDHVATSCGAAHCSGQRWTELGEVGLKARTDCYKLWWCCFMRSNCLGVFIMYPQRLPLLCEPDPLLMGGGGGSETHTIFTVSHEGSSDYEITNNTLWHLGLGKSVNYGNQLQAISRKAVCEYVIEYLFGEHTARPPFGTLPVWALPALLKILICIGRIVWLGFFVFTFLSRSGGSATSFSKLVQSPGQ